MMKNNKIIILKFVFSRTLTTASSALTHKDFILAIFAILACIFCFSGCKSVKETEKKIVPPLSEHELLLLNKLGGEPLEDGNIKLGLAKIDRAKMEISFPAEVNLRSGELEVLICNPGGRTHESLLITELDPLQFQIALLLIGAENGFRIPDASIQQGSLLKIDVETEDGKRHPIEYWLHDKKRGGQRKTDDWVFVGSSFGHDGSCLAKEEGNIANTWTFGNTIIDNPSDDADDDSALEAFTERIPPVGTKVTVCVRKKN